MKKMDQRLDRILSKAAPDILATKLPDAVGVEVKKPKARERRKPAGERTDGDKAANKPRAASRLRRTKVLAMPKKHASPFVNKITQPFVTGSAGKSHNIGIRLQQMDKVKWGCPEPLPRRGIRRAKSIFTQPKGRNTAYKGWIESQEDKMDWTKKTKEMFVGLHNEFAALIDTQANLRKGEDRDEDIRVQLSELERKLEEKELQIHVAVKLYDENQKLKEEVAWLRKNIRPGRRKRNYHPKHSKPTTDPISVPT